MDKRVWCGKTRELWAKPSRPTSVPDLTNVLLEEWSKLHINTLLNLPRRVEVVTGAQGRLTIINH